ncbi:MAG TPA: WbqC family protein [Bacteroidales bacterium]|nr:WbqC family protein [Bacteroidales bacterium]HRZ76834.1 WbqC family protein [Bacteroidales bacterium]
MSQEVPTTLPRVIQLPLLYFPPVSWFVHALEADQVVLGCPRPYRKQTLRNRCAIMSANGPLTLTVPVAKPWRNAAFSEVRPDTARPWRRTHWRAIESAYSRSPFFLYYRDEAESWFSKDRVESLAAFNQACIHDLIRIMQLPVNVNVDQVHGPHEGELTDYAPFFLNRRQEEGSSLMALPEYRQVFSERLPFVPDLSVLDLIFNLGPEAREYLRKAARR